MSEKIFILDEITVKPGMDTVFRDAYLARYAPGARRRGMVLESLWRTPPFDLPEKPSVLYFLWSVAGVGAWWAMRLGAARADPTQDVPLDAGDEKNNWWQEAPAMIVSRKRLFLTDFAGGAG